MQKPGDLLENVLNEIENRIKEDINADILADSAGLSSVHLQRLFKFAFEQSLGSYIRSRKLSATLESLFNTDYKMVNIAHEYGFEYEQSYIRTFKREFGITPGDLRKTWQTVKIKPPLHLLDENKLEDSLFFGPDIVMVPQFHFAGSEHQVLNRKNSINRINELIKHFLENERRQIKTMVNPNIFIGLIRNIKWGDKYSLYTTAVQVENTENVPQGLIAHTFNTSMCARFRYIGQQSYFLDFNNYFIYRMYNSIKGYTQNKQLEYMLFKTDTRFLNQNYYQIELFTPVSEKQ